MTVRSIADRRAWEDFLQTVQPPTFLQSWAWGETQEQLGETVVRLGAYSDDELVGIAQAVTVTARRGRFLHVPHGPVVSGSRQWVVGSREAIGALLAALRDETKRRELAFLRVSPIQEDTPEHRSWYRALGFRPAPIHLHADCLWILDLAPTEEELLAAMRKTTRNLTRRAAREGVAVRVSDTGEGLETFLRLYEETARRERFVPFTRTALEAEIRHFTYVRKKVKNQDTIQQDTGTLVGVAEHRGEPLAVAVVPLTAWSAFYHHGASSRLRPHLPAAYALQWALIQEAKRRGLKEYNFWGVVPTLHTARSPVEARGPRGFTGTLHARHPWSGLTLFKTGFGGREVPLVPAQDLPLSSRYWIAFAVDTYRRWRRGF